MRIESPVGCTSPTGDPAEEKTACDGSASLFTNILDCFRVLLSGSLTEDAVTCEAPAAAGKPPDRSQITPAEASPSPAMTETAATRLNGVRPDDSTPCKNRGEGSEACAGPVPTAPAGASFHWAVPESVGTGQPAHGTSDPAPRQTGARGHEVFAAAVAGMPTGFPQQAEVSVVALDQQGCVPVVETVTPKGDIEEGEGSPASADTASGLGLTPRSGGQGYEVTNPQESTPVAGQTQQSVPVQATAAALMIDGTVFLPDNPSRTDGSTPVLSPFSAHSPLVTPVNKGTETQVNALAASVTPWMPQRSGNAARASTSEPGGQTADIEAAPEPTSVPDGSIAYTRATRMGEGTGPSVDASSEEHLTGPQFLAQKLPEKVLSTISGQPTAGHEAGNRAESRPDTTVFRVDANLPSQAESATRPAGALRNATPVDAATLAVEAEKVLAGRGRPRTIVEGGAREDSAVNSLSAVARDAQISLQATAGVKDVRAPAFVFEVAERISAVVAGGHGEVTIQLKPDQFGRMNIVAESCAGGILARITTESASLKQYLESNLPALQQALQDQGLKVERIDVMLQEGLSQQQTLNQWQHNFGHAPGGHDSGKNARLAAPAQARPAEPANEITLDAVILGALHPHSTFHTVA